MELKKNIYKEILYVFSHKEILNFTTKNGVYIELPFEQEKNKTIVKMVYNKIELEEEDLINDQINDLTTCAINEIFQMAFTIRQERVKEILGKEAIKKQRESIRSVLKRAFWIQN
jgi:hypothetical protein